MIELALNVAAFLFLAFITLIAAIYVIGFFTMASEDQPKPIKEETEENPVVKLSKTQRRARWES